MRLHCYSLIQNLFFSFEHFLQFRAKIPFFVYQCVIKGTPGGSDSKESACNAGDPCLTSGSGRSPGEGVDICICVSVCFVCLGFFCLFPMP